MTDWDSDPELKQLRDEFAASFVQRIAALGPHVQSLKRLSPDLPTPVETGTAIRFIAHNLAGAASTYGFTELGEVSCRLDNLFAGGGSLKVGELLPPAEELLVLLTSCAGSPASAATI